MGWSMVFANQSIWLVDDEENDIIVGVKEGQQLALQLLSYNNGTATCYKIGPACYASIA